MPNLSQESERVYPVGWGKPSSDWINVDWRASQGVQSACIKNIAWNRCNCGECILGRQIVTEARAAFRRDKAFGPHRIRPVLRARVYAHDRIVLTSFFKKPPRLGAEKVKVKAKVDRWRPAALVKPGETRRCWKIGSRWREKPLDTGFTVRGRNMVRDGAHIVEHYSKGIGLFVTTTIAGGTKAVYDCLSAASGYIADRLNRWLRYKVQDGLFVYVWELQKRGAPHMHYLFRLPVDIDVDAFRNSFSEEWRKILLDVSSTSETDLFARAGGGTWRDHTGYPRVDVRTLWGRFGGYLAKYASKRSSKSGGKTAWRPGRWWAVSRPLRKIINRRRLDCRIDIGSIEQGVLIAQTLIESGPELAVTHKWAELPEWYCTKSVSINCPPMVSRALFLALYYFVESGDVSSFAARLSVLRANQIQVKNNGPGS